MKLSDYVVGRLADWGVRHVFLIPGGGSMHLNDSFGRETRIRYICNHASVPAMAGVPAWPDLNCKRRIL
jgi:acetolactate synthase-1/2/3 large subunit